ncbi:hypothetical protein Fmac_024746 [Flemingia macrophylla]|uniref:Uncharacterized protein n=1 Tax=Flemingia macrophylla TaxID=520843 RepID=A0ABD1LQC5_9FABA
MNADDLICVLVDLIHHALPSRRSTSFSFRDSRLMQKGGIRPYLSTLGACYTIETLNRPLPLSRVSLPKVFSLHLCCPIFVQPQGGGLDDFFTNIILWWWFPSQVAQGKQLLGRRRGSQLRRCVPGCIRLLKLDSTKNIEIWLVARLHES